MDRVGVNDLLLIARFVAPSLSSLSLKDTNKSLEVLEVFFGTCRWIRQLELIHFDFSTYPPVAITLCIKEGFSRLDTLKLIRCRESVHLLERFPIPMMQTLVYVADHRASEKDESIMSAITLNHPKIKWVSIYQ